jgi:hypothetical protein
MPFGQFAARHHEDGVITPEGGAAMNRYIAALIMGIVLGSTGVAVAASAGIIRFHNGQSFTNGKVNCSA